MSAIDWVCKKISLESASGQLSAITISGQQVLPSKLDAWANVTTCCYLTPRLLNLINVQVLKQDLFYFLLNVQ